MKQSIKRITMSIVNPNSELAIEMMSQELAEEIMNNKLYLTQHEYDFCFQHTDNVAIETTHIGDYFDHGSYLNLRLYNENDQ